MCTVLRHELTSSSCGKISESFAVRPEYNQLFYFLNFIFNYQARADILRIHSRKMNLTRGINLKKIAETMPGSSGAEIKVCKEWY